MQNLAFFGLNMYYFQQKTQEVVAFFDSLQEEFDDTKGVIIIRISKKNRKHNGQMKNYKTFLGMTK